MAPKQLAALALVFGTLILASRLPLALGQLFSYDDVNFAYAIGDFDPRVSRPQPPGYPLFVLQTKVLHWLRFKRAESNLLALALLGSTAAVVALAWAGNRILGGDAGLCAAWLLLLHPSFWYAGLTSAVRVQLALVSSVVAAACWRAWSGERRWMYWSAVALGIGAGIRPAVGVLLFPLWAASAWRAAPRWRERLRALALLAAVTLIWLVPTVAQSGGPATYARICWEYLADQSALTSGFFGADESRWQATVWWLLVWTLCGTLAWPAAAILAWRRGEGFGLTRTQLGFLALWLAPPAAFAVLVHIADAGQSLAMVPVVCLAGGHLISRAAGELETRLPRGHAFVFLALPAALVLIGYEVHSSWVLLWIPLLCLAAGWLLRLRAAPVQSWIERRQALLFLLIPTFILHWLIFFAPGWYHKGPPAKGLRADIQQAWADIHSGLSFCSLAQIRSIAWTDDHVLGDVRRLAAGRPGRTVIVWERGITAARKAAYYFPHLPVIVLTPKSIAGDQTPVVRIVRGPETRLLEGPAPLRVDLPAGGRVVWLVLPGTDFFRALQKIFPLQTTGQVWYHELAAEGGERLLGGYRLAWGADSSAAGDPSSGFSTAHPAAVPIPGAER